MEVRHWVGRSIRIPNATLPLEGKSTRIDAEGISVAVFRVGGDLYAIDAICTHQQGPLDKGRVSGKTVECPWHGSVFSLEDGQVRRGPATKPVRAYRAHSEGTTLLLEMD